MSTDRTCDLCRTASLITVYRPSKSQRGMLVCVCSHCGLVQSAQTSAAPEDRVKSISSEADWGNIRHGKGARFGAALHILENAIPWDSVRSALEIGSNRGAFVKWMHETHPGIALTAIETDQALAEDYRSQEGLKLIIDRAENVRLSGGQFDFIFSSHTLEHAASACAMLAQSYNALGKGGLMFLEVPNIAAIRQLDIVEEHFIDKHVFHFDRSLLVEYCEYTGFEIIQGRSDEDPFNITLLMRKGPGSSRSGAWPEPNERPADNRESIMRYIETLRHNRELLRSIVEHVLAPLALRQKVAYWGAGRIFDALVKFGGLESKDVYCLVDRFLSGILTEVHGIPVKTPDALRKLEPQVMIVLARSSEDEITRQAQRYGVRHILTFSQLLTQARDNLVATGRAIRPGVEKGRREHIARHSDL